MEKIFDGCSSLELINVKDLNLKNDLKSQILAINLKILTICNDSEKNFETYFTKKNQIICNDLSKDDDDTTPGGFGVTLVKTLSKSYSYEYKNKKSVISLVF